MFYELTGKIGETVRASFGGNRSVSLRYANDDQNAAVVVSHYLVEDVNTETFPYGEDEESKGRAIAEAEDYFRDLVTAFINNKPFVRSDFSMTKKATPKKSAKPTEDKSPPAQNEGE